MTATIPPPLEPFEPRTQPRRVWVWLRMIEVKGTYPVPTSEETYTANLHNIDVVLPTHGGKLQGDGSWLQEIWKYNSAWAQALPNMARDADQLYMPTLTNDRTGVLTVLDNPELQLVAANNLVDLATSGRFDSPWDGVYFDLEGLPATHRQQLTDFYYLVSEKLIDAGLQIGISVKCRTEAPGAHDFATVAEVADHVDIRCYNYNEQRPFSVAPYWWIDASIQFVLDQGIRPEQLNLGLANFSKYWETSTQRFGDEATYDRAIQIVEENNATLEWVECNENGLVREHRAQIGDGYIWVRGEASLRHGLNLVDQYGLSGTALFVPGMGQSQEWQVIGEWRRPNKCYIPYT